MQNFVEAVMDLWCNLIDSLATRGGAIFMLFACCVGLGAMVLHVMHHGDAGEAASIIRSSFAGAFGALLLALKTSTDKASNGNGNGNGQPKDPSTATPH